MKNELIDLINSKSPGGTPLLLVIRGSHAYGTELPTSDTDYAGVFIQKMDDILGNSYIGQINDDKNDIVIYEIDRFLELLEKNNPTILELLNTPEDCILYKHPAFEKLLGDRNRFITKQCANSFGGYAKAQISKAKGQDKKQNWEKDKVARKDILDFVYVISGDKSIPWKVWCENEKFDVKFCGVTNISNARDVYAVFYDINAHNCFSEMVPIEVRNENISVSESKGILGLGFKGIVKSNDGESLSESNQLRLSSIPNGMSPICIVAYNKDAYTQHCKDWSSYQSWLSERNESRWVDVKSHGQMIDGKNMMHCRRLMDMAREIAEGKGIIVRRENSKELISIRKGDVDLKTLIDHVENEIKEVDLLYKNSDLPDKVQDGLINSLLIDIRKEIYFEHCIQDKK